MSELFDNEWEKASVKKWLENKLNNKHFDIPDDEAEEDVGDMSRAKLWLSNYQQNKSKEVSANEDIHAFYQERREVVKKISQSIDRLMNENTNEDDGFPIPHESHDDDFVKVEGICEVCGKPWTALCLDDNDLCQLNSLCLDCYANQHGGTITKIGQGKYTVRRK